MARTVYSYLTMTCGDQVGKSYLLDPTQKVVLGRGLECNIVLTDALSSRAHATLECIDGDWHMFDEGSRNGTFVNGQKADQVVLGDGHLLKIGSTEFLFHQTEVPPTVHGEVPADLTQTIIKEEDMRGRAVFPQSSHRVHEDFLILYQLSIGLLSCQDSQSVIRTSLGLLKQYIRADQVAHLWLNESGTLVPKAVITDDLTAEFRAASALSPSVSRMVCEEGHAIWMANQRPAAARPEQVSDAMWIPLIHLGRRLGALGAALHEGKFSQEHFDFSISVANITAAALARSLDAEGLRADLKNLKANVPGFDEMVGESPPMLALKQKIARLGPATGSALIRGESGVGKELVARAIHRASARSHLPMLSVNCGAIPADLMESQLFGHVAGAFTGAERDHRGYFGQADESTLFLDEIGELSLAGQTKLLRVLEGHPFLPVGGSKEIKVNVRVIAATNQNLETYVRERKFREDLFYRLNVFELDVPALRERGADIRLMAEFFLSKFCALHGRPGLRFSAEAMERILTYSWPGNVRQLRNVVDGAVVLCAGPEINPDDLAIKDATSASELNTLELSHWERKLIRLALGRAQGNVPNAAQLLGIGRATLYRKIEEYNIER